MFRRYWAVVALFLRFLESSSLFEVRGTAVDGLEFGMLRSLAADWFCGGFEAVCLNAVLPGLLKRVYACTLPARIAGLEKTFSLEVSVAVLASSSILISSISSFSEICSFG